MKKYHFEILDQLEHAIKLFEPSAYSQKLDVLHGVSVGQHFRHIIEFYECLGLASQTGLLNYDKRKRDFGIENSPYIALQKLERIRECFSSNDWQKSIVLECNLGGTCYQIPSSLNREMIYLTEHSIHHFALIKVAITACFEEIEIDANFGVAPSTLAFQQKISH